MRNPLESWKRSDSEFINGHLVLMGGNDLDLATRLIKAGPEHRKFARQIQVWVDITAPIFWWKEFDTYKIGTTANSTSTMHKIASKPITIDCFEIGDYDSSLPMIDDINLGIRTSCLIDDLEQLRQKYIETKDKKYWKELIRWLPESWLQTRTINLNYEVIMNIYHQRKGHKLKEWSSFCEWAEESLPYFKEFYIDTEVI